MLNYWDMFLLNIKLIQSQIQERLGPIRGPENMSLASLQQEWRMVKTFLLHVNNVSYLLSFGICKNRGGTYRSTVPSPVLRAGYLGSARMRK